MTEVAIINNDKFETVDDAYKIEVFSVYENMFQLISECEQFVINDKASYEKAEELKRKTKQVHIAIKDKGDELAERRRIETRDMKTFVNAIYTPIREAELVLKEKMDVYKQISKQANKEQLLAREQERQNNSFLDEQLRELNGKLREINDAKNIEELEVIENYLNEVNVNDFENKSHEAGFILIQLTATLKSVKGKFLMNHPHKEKKEALSNLIGKVQTAQKNIQNQDLFGTETETIQEEKSISEVQNPNEKKRLKNLSLDETYKLVESSSDAIYKHFAKVIDLELTKYIEDLYEVDLFTDMDIYKSLETKVRKKFIEKISKL